MSDDKVWAIVLATIVITLLLSCVKGCEFDRNADLAETQQRRSHELQMAKIGYKQGVLPGSDKVVWLPDTTKVRGK